MTPKDRIKRLEEDKRELLKEIERLKKYETWYQIGELRYSRAAADRASK